MPRSAANPDFMSTYLYDNRPPHTDMIDASVALWLIDIEAAEPALWQIEEQTPRLSWRGQMDFQTDVNGRRARARFSAHVALRLVLERWLGAKPVRGVAFNTAKNGKPFLAGSGLDFSLSYSENMVLIGVRAGGAIGVDLECERRLRLSEARRAAIIAVADRFNEQKPLRRRGDDGTLFLQAWTRIEAVAKATGLGIGSVLGHFGLIGPGKHRRANQPGTAMEFIDNYDLVVNDLDVEGDLFAAIAQIRGTVVPKIREMPISREALEAFAGNHLQRR